MRDYNIESDLKQEKFEVIKLVQGDKGNKLTINVLEDGKPVSLTGCSITAKYKRADGQVINGSVTNISNNSFDAVIDSDITKVSGVLKMLFSIEKDDVKVSTFLLLADVREGLLENTGSSGGGEVTVDLKDYQKKTDNGLETKNKYIVGAINEVNSQCKDIANNQPTDLSLDSATNLLQLVNSKGSKLGKGITLPMSSGGGTSQYLHIKYSSTGAPQLAGQISDTPNAYIGLCVDTNADSPTNPKNYTWYNWKGDNGDTGATPNLQIGTVETLESGSSATASITGTTENPLLNLGIPRGEGGTGGSEKEWKLLKDLTLTETVSAITEIFDNDYKEILIIAKGKAGGTSDCGMAITSYSENQASGVDLVLSSMLWQVNKECTFSIYLCAENPVLFLIWKRCNNSNLSSIDGTYNSANWNDKKGINKLLFRYGAFAEGNNYKIYGR
nr:MAG TPA: hypothetical protein [Caudoviricetes sp.]